MTTRHLRNITKNHNCEARYDRLTERAYYSGGYTGTSGNAAGTVHAGYYYDPDTETASDTLQGLYEVIDRGLWSYAD